ncbi:hypothetical protein GQX74_006773 [Glossina fuscipes]|nr:hypothetical protein GQX74_006773 [Glossina fuscipes]
MNIVRSLRSLQLHKAIEGSNICSRFQSRARLSHEPTNIKVVMCLLKHIVLAGAVKENDRDPLQAAKETILSELYIPRTRFKANKSVMLILIYRNTISVGYSVNAIDSVAALLKPFKLVVGARQSAVVVAPSNFKSPLAMKGGISSCTRRLKMNIGEAKSKASNQIPSSVKTAPTNCRLSIMRKVSALKSEVRQLIDDDNIPETARFKMNKLRAVLIAGLRITAITTNILPRAPNIIKIP